MLQFFTFTYKANTKQQGWALVRIASHAKYKDKVEQKYLTWY